MGSIVLNDITDSILRTANLPNHTAGFTMSGWVKFTTSTAGTQRWICGLMTNGTGASSGAMQWTDNTYLSIANSIGNSISPSPADNVWIYLAVTGASTDGSPTLWWWDSNGVFQASNGAAGLPSGTAIYMCVGNEGRLLDRGRLGKYAYWKVWNEELTQTQIETEIFSPTVIRTLNFNTGFADTAVDIGPNGRNWTLTGTVADTDTPPVSNSKFLMFMR
jgi:hypothetical protein